MIPQATEARQPDLRGERAISRKPLRGDAGCCWRPRCEYSCAHYPLLSTRGCGCAWHPAFPTPSVYRAKNSRTTRAVRAARMRRRVLPSLRGAKATKQSSFLCAVRWIASLALAMTKTEPRMRNTLTRHHPRKRVIQYPRGGCNRTEKPQRTGYSAFAEYDELWWGTTSDSIKRNARLKKSPRPESTRRASSGRTRC
jgi:hypothetical protein